jgi:hypothetical protein
LSAYHLPGKSEETIAKMSPVNNFRMIFNEYFGTNFKILENKSFLGPLKAGGKGPYMKKHGGRLTANKLFAEVAKW